MTVKTVEKKGILRMGVLKPVDFYYGAFLSALLNYAGKKPSLFDETDSRRIYCLSTQQSGKDYYIYTKYATCRQSKQGKTLNWIFPFSRNEVMKLQELQTKTQNVYVALICVTNDLKDSELALLKYNEAMDCLGDGKNSETYRINVLAVENKRGLRVYGTGRKRKLDNGKDNQLTVPRDVLKQL